jgi:formylglycine-generating enzyme required for sulfatase activity
VSKLRIFVAALAFASLHAYAKDDPKPVGKEDGGATVAGKSFKDCDDCPEMVVIPAGSSDMGSNDGGDNEKPAHRVTIAQSFAMGRTEVTQGQWKAVMGDNPSRFGSCGDDCPVEMVSWKDAQAFVLKLSDKTGKQYRLPSEAEWEYACRAGGAHLYCGGDDPDSVSWYGGLARPPGNSGKTTNPVATRQPNAFGLYDMSGNVWEWVEDGYHENYIGAPTDGSVWQGDGALRVLRGGSWSYLQRAAKRGGSEASYRFGTIGFRLARTLP